MGYFVLGENTGKFSITQVIGTLALFCTMSEFAILTPSIAAFSEHFASTDITTIMLANSITGIVSVPVSIISGALLTRFGFKPTAVFGILLMSLGGAFPFLLSTITDYNIIISSRVIVGIGLGIMFPVGNATIIARTSGSARARLLGLGVTIQFLFALLYTTIAGYLTEWGWNWSFLAYLVGLIPLVLVLIWMPESKELVRQEKKGSSGTTDGTCEFVARIKRYVSPAYTPPAIWGFAVYALVAWICVVAVQVVTSNILSYRGFAGPALAALVINCCGIGSILCGLVFPYILGRVRQYTFALGGLFICLGLIPCYLAQSNMMYALGLFVLGFGGSLFFTSAQQATGNLARADQVSFVSGIMMSMMNLGPFLAPYVFSLSMMAIPQMGLDALFPVLFISALVCTIVGVVHPMRSLTKPLDKESR